jgi:hypothetical protein
VLFRLCCFLLSYFLRKSFYDNYLIGKWAYFNLLAGLFIKMLIPFALYHLCFILYFGRIYSWQSKKDNFYTIGMVGLQIGNIVKAQQNMKKNRLMSKLSTMKTIHGSYCFGFLAR